MRKAPANNPLGLSRHGLELARALIGRLHQEALDKAALGACPDARDLLIEGDNGSLRARLYVPPGADAPGPLLVFFHGGGFVLCNVESHDALCRRLAGASRVRLLSVDYRLAPEHRFPAMHRDAAAAFRWAVQKAHELGADPRRIAVGGDSAGGHMAAWTALEASTRPAGLLLLYPLLDVGETEWVGSSLKDFRFLGRAAVSYIRRQIDDYRSEGGALDGFRIADRDLARLPPTVLVEVGLDPLSPGIRAFGEKARAAGTSIEHRCWPRLAHGAFNFAYLSRQARQAIDETGVELGKMLGVRP